MDVDEEVEAKIEERKRAIASGEWTPVPKWSLTKGSINRKVEYIDQDGDRRSGGGSFHTMWDIAHTPDPEETIEGWVEKLHEDFLEWYQEFCATHCANCGLHVEEHQPEHDNYEHTCEPYESEYLSIVDNGGKAIYAEEEE